MITHYLEKQTSAAPLIIFRIAFGLLVFAGIVRFWINGWIDQLYIQPKVFFTYYGFEWVKPLGPFTYLLFAICGAAALMVAIGYYYRIASILLFLSFTYIELIDKSTYLNHYYFVSMISLLMIFLPANASFSLDVRRKPSLASHLIPKWSLDSLKIFVCLLYFCAGLAKINSDWLLNAMPLRIWLPAKNDLFLIGGLLDEVWVAYAFSWFGCLYDLSIPFLLWNNATRKFAYIAVVVFHVMTSILFQIGMFPYIMIVTALIFFPPSLHQSIIAWIKKRLRNTTSSSPVTSTTNYARTNKFALAFIVIFLLVQALLPFRYVLYPGELFWTEEGYRFSWRVMLMEKAGHAEFIVRDDNGKHVIVDNTEFLTTLQEKMMSTQPDMILQYAHVLRDHYQQLGFINPQVYVDSYVVMNGRSGRPLIDPKIDLAKQEDSLLPKPWIVRYSNEVKGI